MNMTNEPSEIEFLLPWYAAGTLSEREAREVEAALERDPDLASRYEWVREELAQETAINEAAPAPSERELQTVWARIDALPRRRTAISSTLQDRIAEFFAGFAPRTLAWSAAAAALVIALQAGVLAELMIKETAGSYSTASAPANNPGGGAFVQMRFAPDATGVEIANFLTDHKLSIVDGPAAGQLYLVRVAPTKLDPAALTRIVKVLQGDKAVGFVAAVQ